jgi:hypothetical protein
MEGLIEEEAVQIIKLKVNEMAVRELEAVVSINHASFKEGDKVSDIGQAVNQVVDFCKETGIRVYSYYNK